MTDTYTIRAEDGVSGPAAKMATAYARVAVTAGALAGAIREGDKDQVRFARSASILAGAELRAARAVMTAGSAISKLARGTKTAGDETDKAARKAKGFSYALNALATAGANAAFSLAGKVVSSLVSIGASLYETAVQASRTKLGFKTLFGGVAEGAAAMQQATALSRKYGVELDVITRAITSFKGAGFEMPQIDALIKLGADMKALGSTPEQIESAFLAFRKIQSQGYLQGDELNMLSEAGVSVDKIYTNLEKTLGKTREQIVKMQGNRQLQAGDTLNAVASSILQTGGATDFGQLGGEAANTTVGGLGDRIQAEVKASITQGVLDAEPALVKGMQAVLKGLTGADGTSLQSQLTSALVKVGEGLENLGPQLPGFVAQIGRLADHLDAIVTTMKVIGFIPMSFVHVGEDIGNALGGARARTAAMGVEETPSDAPGWREWKAARKRGEAIGDGLRTGIESSAPSVAAAGSNAVQGGLDAISNTAQIHSPSRVTFEQGQYLAEGLALGVDAQADLAARSAQVMTQGAVSEVHNVTGEGAAATAAGAAAGSSFARSSVGGTRIGDVHFDVHLGGAASGEDAVQQMKDFVEFEMAALLERAMQGSGA